MHETIRLNSVCLLSKATSTFAIGWQWQNCSVETDSTIDMLEGLQGGQVSVKYVLSWAGEQPRFPANRVLHLSLTFNLQRCSPFDWGKNTAGGVRGPLNSWACQKQHHQVYPLQTLPTIGRQQKKPRSLRRQCPQNVGS